MFAEVFELSQITEEKGMDRGGDIRKQAVSQFAGITIDMDYRLCIPSVHAVCQGEEAVIDFGGRIRSMTEAFPKEKAERVLRWVSMHEKEIQENHYRLGHGIEPLLMIDPLDD